MISSYCVLNCTTIPATARRPSPLASRRPFGLSIPVCARARSAFDPAPPSRTRRHSTYQDPYYIYMLMDYVAGGDFFSHLRAARRFPPETAKHYIACIVLALDYVHSKNVIYRDLKPENLLLDEKGRIKITDFGLAKRTADRCGPGQRRAAV